MQYVFSQATIHRIKHTESDSKSIPANVCIPYSHACRYVIIYKLNGFHAAIIKSTPRRNRPIWWCHSWGNYIRPPKHHMSDIISVINIL